MGQSKKRARPGKESWEGTLYGKGKGPEEVLLKNRTGIDEKLGRGSQTILDKRW